jgi:hypothetical protein
MSPAPTDNPATLALMLIKINPDWRGKSKQFDKVRRALP